MAVYTDSSEITDITIRSIKSDQTEWENWLETYLLRADAWFLERCEELAVAATDVTTYADGQKFSVIATLRYWVYLEVFAELRANGIVDTDDYNSKIKGEYGYVSLFDQYNKKLSSGVVGGGAAEIDVNTMTSRRITLNADYNGKTIDD